MSLNLDLLEQPRLRGGKLIARCPACRETDHDKNCEHLFIADEGRGAFGCIAFTGRAGVDHRKRIWELAGERPDSPRPRQLARRAPGPPLAGRPQLHLPPLRPLAVSEMAAVIHRRGWPAFASLELLGRRGLLWQGMVWDDGREWPAWIITDRARRNAQARRLDGQPWHGIGGKKAKSLPGSESAWPIGASEIGDRTFAVLCEGQPDFCAALLVAWFEGRPCEEVAAVCMTGAGNEISPDALPMFAGRHIRIAVHDDCQGRDAGERWAGQLYGAGATRVDWFAFAGLARRDGQPVKDLADFATTLDLEGPAGAHLFREFQTLRV